MKQTIISLFLFIRYTAFSQMDPATLALCRANQCAQELSLYTKFSKSEDNRFQFKGQNFKKKEKAFYEKGRLFRYFETSNDLLNGTYEVYYRNGNLFLKTFYVNNFIKDTTKIFYENGKLKTMLLYKAKFSFQVIHYYENGNLKRKIWAEHPVECTDFSNLNNSRLYPSKTFYYTN